MKKKIMLIIAGILILIVILAKNVGERMEEIPKGLQAGIENQEEYITRAQTAKMLGLLYYSDSEINSLERVIVYQDTEDTLWYDKYINGIYTLGLTESEENEGSHLFRPMDFITYGECASFVQRFLLTYNEELEEKKSQLDYGKIIEKSGVYWDEDKVRELIPVKDWLNIYQSLLNSIPGNGITEQALYILGTPDTDSEHTEWEIVTNEGKYNADGLLMKSYVDTSMSAIVKGKEILYAKETLQQEIILKNVWILSNEGKKINVYVNGIERSFQAENELSKKLQKVVGDLTLKDKMVSRVSIKPEVINGKVLVANDEYIELKEYGKLYLEKDYKIYKIYGEVTSEISNGILVGYNATDFVVSDGKICAALIKNSIKAENIRVLIKTNNFKDIFHKTVKVTSDSDFTMKYGKKTKSYKAGKTAVIKTTSDVLKEGRLTFSTKKENGKLKLLSLKRNGENPEYRGTIEIEKNKQGFTIINELSLEEYLYGVIPSEMPVSYGVEALKVQAVCARSYAYNQLMDNRYSSYGAHVDDSVSYQVYNNSKESEDAIQAVKDTYGKVLNSDGKIITAYYFSTSCGHTANAYEVWPGSPREEYLRGHIQTKNINSEGKLTEPEEETDLSNEKKFREFLQDKESITYDSDFAWYRWKVTISLKDLKKNIDQTLKNRYTANPGLIQRLQEKKGKEKYESVSVNTVGEIKKIEVTGRGTGGVVTEIVITGTENTVRVQTEYNIRILLSPVYDTVKRQDQSTISGLAMLPSGFFVMDEKRKDGKLTGYDFSGGGYGHGVGMSQNGVKTLTDLGVEYEDILKHYYRGVEIGFIY